MKIAWITNILLNDISVSIYNKSVNNLWMGPLLQKFKMNSDHELIVITSGNTKEIIFDRIDNISYYIMPGGIPGKNKETSVKSLEVWQEIFELEKPDIVHIWGTEYSFSLNAIKVSKKLNIPSVVFIQGISRVISRYTQANINSLTLLKYTTLRDIYRNELILFQDKIFLKNASIEKKMLEASGNFFYENFWSELHSKYIAPNAQSYFLPLSINQEFYDFNWDISKMNHQTIICNASGYPLKGLHILLRAIALVKVKYPNIKLVVPGTNLICKPGFFNRIKSTGYKNYITDLIQELELNNNIEFVGQLSSKELAKLTSTSNIFVLSSSLENHSSSLKEAMLLGIPCIASNVGGVSEYLEHDKSGFLYRFEEYEYLAYYIDLLFKNNDKCLEFSKNAREKILNFHNLEKDYELLINSYSTIINTEMRNLQ